MAYSRTRSFLIRFNALLHQSISVLFFKTTDFHMFFNSYRIFTEHYLYNQKSRAIRHDSSITNQLSRGNHSRDNSIITMQLALAKLFIGHLLFQASFYNYIEQIIKERTNTHNIFKGIIRHSILIFFSKLHSSSPHPINSFSYSSHFKNSPNFSVYGISNPSNIFSTVVISDLSSIIRL